MRITEKELVTYVSAESQAAYIAIYDLQKQSRMQALFGIVLTSIVCVALGSSSMILSKTTTDLVISPIEEMIKKVHRIAENPLKAA